MKYNIGDFKVKLGEKIIKVKPWTSRDERAWLSQKTENTTFADMCNALVFPNMEYIPMTLDEFKYVVLKLRGQSVSNKIAFSYICTGKLRFKVGENGMTIVPENEVDEQTIIQDCNNKIDERVDIDEIVNFIPSTLDDIKEISSNDIIIKMHKIPTKELMLKVLSQTDTEEQKYYEFLACIKELNYDGKNINTFTFDELKEFFDSVPSNIFNELYEKFYEVKGIIKFFVSRECPVCHQKNKIFFDDTLEFL